MDVEDEIDGRLLLIKCYIYCYYYDSIIILIYRIYDLNSNIIINQVFIIR